jgi:hypothetical protein
VPLRREPLLVLGVILALVGVGCAGSGELRANDLSQQAKTLQSEAAEGALLAQDAASGKTTGIYTREHASDLIGATSQAEVSLRSATAEPALLPQLRRLTALAGKVSADLDRLGDASADEARALARRLRAAARAIERIGTELT